MNSFLERALSAIPGGVNSPVRAFHGVDAEPFFVREAQGAYLQTEDGRKLIDFCLSFGPLILGHAHRAVVSTIIAAAKKGTSYAVTTEAELRLAELIRSAIPSMEKVRLVSSGTEAAMTAVRLARGFTGRAKILKFSGCYHGHADCMLVQAGSGVAGIASASSAGVPEAFARETLVAPYNDLAAAQALMQEHGADLAAVIIEPIAANMGLILPKPGFLAELRQMCTASGALLIFDEVITGFRLCFGGFQKLCAITPDITCLGKIIGGGMPIGALGGRRDIMDHLAPLGRVYQAGTLSGNPLSVASGLATLETLAATLPYAGLEQAAEAFAAELRAFAAKTGLELQVPQCGSMFSLFFSAEPVESFADTQHCDSKTFAALFHQLLQRGVYIPPSPFEVCFISTAHDHALLETALHAFTQSFAELGN